MADNQPLFMKYFTLFVHIFLHKWLNYIIDIKDRPRGINDAAYFDSFYFSINKKTKKEISNSKKYHKMGSSPML